MLTVIMLIVLVLEYSYAECRYAEVFKLSAVIPSYMNAKHRYAECHLEECY
jgi:hypothetical protein